MWILFGITNIMSYCIFTTIIYIIGSTCNIDSINETVFAKGIGKVPKGFFMTGGNEVKLVANTTNGAALYLTMQEETARDGTIADENELAEEGATTFLNEVLDFLASGYADDAVAA